MQAATDYEESGFIQEGGDRRILEEKSLESMMMERIDFLKTKSKIESRGPESEGYLHDMFDILLKLVLNGFDLVQSQSHWRHYLQGLECDCKELKKIAEAISSQTEPFSIRDLLSIARSRLMVFMDTRETDERLHAMRVALFCEGEAFFLHAQKVERASTIGIVECKVFYETAMKRFLNACKAPFSTRYLFVEAFVLMSAYRCAYICSKFPELDRLWSSSDQPIAINAQFSHARKVFDLCSSDESRDRYLKDFDNEYELPRPVL